MKTVDRNILLALGWYYPEIHRGVARFARDHHWHLTADFDDPVPKHWKGDGILTLLGARQNIWRDLKHLKVPIVDLAESRPEIELPRVTMDNAEIARMAADYFLNRGYRHFAFVQRWDLGVSRRRSSCFRERIETKGFQCNVLSWQRDRKKQSDTRENRHGWLTRRLTELPNPLAVFARDSEAVAGNEHPVVHDGFQQISKYLSRSLCWGWTTLSSFVIVFEYHCRASTIDWNR